MPFVPPNQQCRSTEGIEHTQQQFIFSALVCRWTECLRLHQRTLLALDSVSSVVCASGCRLSANHWQLSICWLHLRRRPLMTPCNSAKAPLQPAITAGSLVWYPCTVKMHTSLIKQLTLNRCVRNFIRSKRGQYPSSTAGGNYTGWAKKWTQSCAINYAKYAAKTAACWHSDALTKVRNFTALTVTVLKISC